MIVRIWHGMTAAAKSDLYLDYLRAKYYPEDEKFLLDFEPTVDHHEVLASPTTPTRRMSGVRNFPGC